MNMAPLVRVASRVVNGARLWGRRRHGSNVAYSRVVLARLTALPNEGAVINYLRKVDPFVVEEVVLTLLEERGIFVLRNRAYTGDGGVDGSFWWPGRGWHAIQCKRYSSAVKASHAREFCDLVKRQYRGGVFAHTGRTGDMTQEAMAAPSLFVLSGSTLTRSIKGGHPLELMDRRKSARSRPAMVTA